MPPKKNASSTPQSSQLSISRFFLPKNAEESPKSANKNSPANVDSPTAPRKSLDCFAFKTPRSEHADECTPASKLIENDEEEVLITKTKRKRTIADSPDDDDETTETQAKRPRAETNIIPRKLGKDDPDAEMVDQDEMPTTVSKKRLVQREHGDEQDAGQTLYEPDEKLRKRFMSKLVPLEGDKTLSNEVHNAAAAPDRGPSPQTGKPLAGGTYSAMLKNAKAKEYTPLELQFLKIKEQNPDVLLLVECGYKYRFFDRDAEIAAKVLNIFSHMDHKFQTASIPTFRLHIHVQRLVDMGYKVGVVRQMESAALKAASVNKTGPFSRELTAIYTKGTLIGEGLEPMADASEGTHGASTRTTYLMCLFEERADSRDSNMETAEKVIISFVAVDALTGDVVYDTFQDGHMRSGLETRLSYLQPAELILPSSLSKYTEKLITLAGAFDAREQCRATGIRMERVDRDVFTYGNAVSRVSDFYTAFASADADKDTGNGAQVRGSAADGEEGSSQSSVVDVDEGPADISSPSLRAKSRPLNSSLASKGEGGNANALQQALKLPHSVISCLGALLFHLGRFSLQDCLRTTSTFRHFSAKTQMMLNGTTLANLEILTTTAGQLKGSLLWLMNHTSTPFGARLLKQWVSHPLLDKSEILSRQEAVAEIAAEEAPCLKAFADSLKHMPDLERALCRIQYKKVTPQEFFSTMQALAKASKSVSIATVQEEVQSPLLRTHLDNIPPIADDVQYFLQTLDPTAAAAGKKESLFRNPDTFPAIAKAQKSIDVVEEELRKHLVSIRQRLKKPSLDYTSILQTEYIIEIPNSDGAIKWVPNDWMKVSSTKVVSRFHTPLVQERLKKLGQHREELTLAVNAAWDGFLEEVASKYGEFRNAIRSIAILDCLFSLAAISHQPGYVRPSFVDESQLVIEEGRHPMVEAVSSNPYVPNSIQLTEDGLRCLIITGPNMGGKSSYIRQTALIVIMAQIGSFVPAQSATLGVFDAVYTRMGASDDIGRGRSTFMVELQEAAHVLKYATKRSLVILDELGRGTSTHDGMAIAYATLHHVVTALQSCTLFVTHYPTLGELASTFATRINNVHMSYIENKTSEDEDSTRDIPIITFLYKVTNGIADRSFGLNVARLAHLPESIIQHAAIKSREMDETLSDRTRRRKEQESRLKEARDAIVRGFEEDKSPLDILENVRTLLNV